MLTEYPVEESSLSSLEDQFDYVNLLECKCDSCESWKLQSPKQTRWLFSGLLIPFIWIYNSTRILITLFYINHKPLSVDQYIVFQNQKVYTESNVKGLHRYEGAHIIYHQKQRKEMLDGLGHCVLALSIYIIMVLMIIVVVYCAGAI